MSRLGWAMAFVITASAAVSLYFVKAARRPRGEERVLRRDPADLSDGELNVILHSIRGGDLYAIRGDWEAARRAWSEARARGEGYWQIHEGLADSYARFDLREDAIREYAVAAEVVSWDLPEMRKAIVRKRALLLGEVGRWEEGFLALLESGDPKLLEFYEKGRDKSRMLAALRGKAEENPALYDPLSEVLRKEGSAVEAARAVARYARSAVPWDGTVARKAVEQLRTHRLHSEAIQVCRAWARARPQQTQAYRLMGDVWKEAGDSEKAYLAYTSMVDVRPGDADAHRELGRALREMKKYDEALAQFERSKQLRPEEPDRWSDIAETLACTDSAAAERCYEEIAKRTWEPRFQETVRSVQAGRQLLALENAKRAGDGDRVREIRRVLSEYHVPEGLYDLKVIMTWDTQTDIDLDILDPTGEHVYHGNSSSKAGGKYWVDNTRGLGPETFTLSRAPVGVYRIGAHFHSGSGRTTVRFQILLHEETERERRIDHTLVLEHSGEQQYLPDVAEE